MKFLMTVIIFLLTYTASLGQHIVMGLGKTQTTFDYKNSQGERLENLMGSMQNTLYVGYKHPVLLHNMYAASELMYNKFYVGGHDPVPGNFFEWDTQYIGLNIGLEYEFIKFRNFYFQKNGVSIYLKTAASVDYLMAGTQNINNSFYDLVGEEEFDKPLVFFKGGGGANYYFSKTICLHLQYMYGKSFLVFDNYTNKEQLRFDIHSITIGASINMAQSRPIY